MPRRMAPRHALSWRWKSIAAALLALVAAALAAPSAVAETRFALVIGNGAYRNVPALNNPPSDAKDIAAALKSLGFKVTLKLDLDLAAMQRAIDEFAYLEPRFLISERLGADNASRSLPSSLLTKSRSREG